MWERPVLRNTTTKAIDFFFLFFTTEIIEEICRHTNAYAWHAVTSKPYYGDKHDAWIETTPEEIRKLIALILYMGLVKVSSFQRYWSTKTLYHGLWARTLMSRDRFKVLMAVLHIVDPSKECEQDKLRKVTSFVDKFKAMCKSLYQPAKNIAIDERMVKSKHRSGIQQYIKNKPTKWGIKLWVLADSLNGYTYDFDVYIGRAAGQGVSENGLGYDVIMKLMRPLLNQGYHLFFDNFYMSTQLIKDLFVLGTPTCGTVCEKSTGVSRVYAKRKGMGKKGGKRKYEMGARWYFSGNSVERQQACNNVDNY